MRLTTSVGLYKDLLTADNVCIESLSIDLFDDTLKKATRGVNSLEKKIEKYI
jgi:DNA excision repair protein ERCC-2